MQLSANRSFNLDYLPSFESNEFVRSELVFIDSKVADIETLTDNISGVTEVVVLDSDRDELLQISEHLSRYNQLDAVHIVSHGASGQLSFANTALNSNNLSEYEDLLQDWRQYLGVDADLLFYGCDLTSSEIGNSFVEELSRLTGSDVAASDDLTGQGGDWELEAKFGEVDTESVFAIGIAESYQHSLAEGDFSFTSLNLPDFSGSSFNSNSIDFANIPTDNLSIFAQGGLDFSNLDAGSLSKIDFNNIPVEDLSILADAGLRLEPLSPQEISQINLDTFVGLNYFQGVDFTSISSLSGKTTFGQLSSSVAANADLFSYKNPTLSLDSGLTIKGLGQLSQSDFQALDYAFTGDEIFDSGFYLAENPDVVAAQLNPFTHYFQYGVKEGRDPNAFFDSSFYLDQNSDVRIAGVNPLNHYIQSGASEGRDPNVFFDSSFYLNDNPDVKNAEIEPLTHFINSGLDEGRYTNQVFKSFGKSEGALVASADLSGIKFEQFKTFAEDTNEIAIVPALAIPFVVIKGVEILAITAASLTIIKAASNIQEVLSGSNVDIFVPEGDFDSSIPPFDLGEVKAVDVESFPSGNQFLEDVLNGKFEFPDVEKTDSFGPFVLPIETGIPEGIDLEQTALINPERQTHILDGEPNSNRGGHRFGTGRSGKTEFPQEWSDEVILKNIGEVVKDPKSTWTQQVGSGGRLFTRKGDPSIWKVEGTVDGIDIRVVVEPAGEGIITAFPTNTPQNP